MMRLKKLLNNIIWGGTAKFINIVGPFVIRTLIIYTIGNEYLGLDSLFVSILSILNVAELGLGSAMVYFLYKPMAENDYVTVRKFLNFYKKAYRIIGSIILLVGIMIMPFLEHLIKGAYPENINLWVLYFIYLTNSVISFFFFAYKQVILKATQRNDIDSKIIICIKFILYFAQSLSLLTVKNYYIYIIFLPISTILINCFESIVIKKMYPDLYCEGTLEKETLKIIFSKVISLSISKLLMVCRNSLDSIIISSFLGLIALAQYQNYYYIISAIGAIFVVIIEALISTVGNAIATENSQYNYNLFKKISFAFNWLSGVSTICLFCTLQVFITLWIGLENQLNYFTAILFCIYFYLLRIGDIAALYIESAGLWNERKKFVILETVLNLFLNIPFIMLWGLNGVIIATLLSLLLVNLPATIFVVFKYYFKKNIWDYCISELKFILITIFSCLIAQYLCSILHIDNKFLIILYRFIIAFGIGNLSFLILFYTSEELAYFYIKGKQLCQRVFH